VAYYFFMKYFIIPLLVLFSQSLIAEEVCELDTGNLAFEELTQFNCETINKISCAERAVDPNAIRTRITKQLEFVEKEKENIINRYDQVYSKTFWSQFFDYNPAYKHNNSSYKAIPILDWFTDDGKIPAISKDEVKAKLIDNYVKFAEQNDCTPILKHQYTHIEFPQGLKTRSEQELQKEINKIPDFEKQKDDFFDQYNKNAIERGSYCEKSRSVKQRFKYTHLVHQPCSGNVSGFFKDNEWNTSSLDQQLSGESANEVVNCIKERIRNGGTIHHITISASASALNNTGEAASRFCKKGFHALSEARAEAARDRILPQLFSRAGAADYNYAPHVEINASGRNGDGSSGPCPYKLVNGVEVLKDEYKTTAGKKELADAKYVRIHVTFNESKTPHPDTGDYYHNRYFCRNLRFECAPVGSDK
jgi:hypothetical protein